MFFSCTFLLSGVLADLSTNFSVQRQDNHGFSAVACDQTIEQTVNRASKTKGGLVGFSMNRAAVHRWLLSQPERAGIAQQCKSLAGMNDKSRYSTLVILVHLTVSSQIPSLADPC